MPYLVFRRRGLFMMQFKLGAELRTFGRDGADIEVDVPGIAPIQAELSTVEGPPTRYLLTDCSGQGTLVNGEAVRSAALLHGAVITLDDCEATFLTHLPPKPGEDGEGETARGEPADVVLPRALLVIAEIPGRPDSRREMRFEGSLEIGSAAAPGRLQLVAPEVSALHARLSRQMYFVTLQDLRSTNGTHCESGWIFEMGLRLGAVFMVGPFEVRVEAATKKDAPRPPPACKSLGEMLSVEPVMHELFAEVRRLARRPGRVLIHGESGTGKELIAKALHHYSDRARGPCFTVNCGTFTGDGAADAIFGHVRGAYTGANDERLGAFQKADGGTLFLDEVAELPMPAQIKLLRVLETGELQPLGSDDIRKVDVRVVAASLSSLLDEVRAGRFRRDLFYRLNCFPIELPPLRARLGDVLMLWLHYVALRRPDDTPVTSPEAIKMLLAYDWPGNVRMLQHVVERALTRCAGRNVILPSDLRFDAPEPGAAVVPAGGAEEGGVDPTEMTWREFQVAGLKRVMQLVKGNRREAARRLKISRTTVIRMLKAHGLEREGLPDGEPEDE